MITWGIIIGVVILGLVIGIMHHQRRLKLRAHLMQEAIRNKDFSFRLPTNNLLPGERAMQEALNQFGDTIRQELDGPIGEGEVTYPNGDHFKGYFHLIGFL